MKITEEHRARGKWGFLCFFKSLLIKPVLVNSSMNTRKKGVFGGVHPQTHLFFGNLVVHTFVDEYTLLIKPVGFVLLNLSISPRSVHILDQFGRHCES